MTYEELIGKQRAADLPRRGLDEDFSRITAFQLDVARTAANFKLFGSDYVFQQKIARSAFGRERSAGYVGQLRISRADADADLRFASRVRHVDLTRGDGERNGSRVNAFYPDMTRGGMDSDVFRSGSFILNASRRCGNIHAFKLKIVRYFRMPRGGSDRKRAVFSRGKEYGDLCTLKIDADMLVPCFRIGKLDGKRTVFRLYDMLAATLLIANDRELSVLGGRKRKISGIQRDRDIFDRFIDFIAVGFILYG